MRNEKEREKNVCTAVRSMHYKFWAHFTREDLLHVYKVTLVVSTLHCFCFGLLFGKTTPSNRIRIRWNWTRLSFSLSLFHSLSLKYTTCDIYYTVLRTKKKHLQANIPNSKYFLFYIRSILISFHSDYTCHMFVQNPKATNRNVLDYLNLNCFVRIFLVLIVRVFLTYDWSRTHTKFGQITQPCLFHQAVFQQFESLNVYVTNGSDQIIESRATRPWWTTFYWGKNLGFENWIKKFETWRPHVRWWQRSTYTHQWMLRCIWWTTHLKRRIHRKLNCSELNGNETFSGKCWWNVKKKRGESQKNVT